MAEPTRTINIGQVLGFPEFIPSFATATDADISTGVNYGSGGAGIRDESGSNLYKGSIKGGYNVNDNEMKSKEIRDVNLGNIKDVEMNENATIRKPLSFASVIKGLSNGGKNKLKYVPMITNETGNKVVDMDLVVKESSKKWGLTLVGSEEGLMNVIEKGHWNMAITEEEVTRENDKKVVNDKKSIGNINGNKGCGFNGRGKSGMSNKGGYDRGRMGGVPKNSEEVFFNVDNANNKNKKLKEKTNEELKAKSMNESQKKMETMNRFSMLNEVMEEDNVENWQQLKHKIDVACEMQIPIPNEEMISWSTYERKIVEANRMVKTIAQEKANSGVEERMKSENMNRNQAFGVFALNLPMTDDVKSGWTEEMIEAFKGILEEIRNDEINRHWE
ncbi:hypothetical protein Tco_1361454 [Tanacetum coccineum]